jgi:hypothetical protein
VPEACRERRLPEPVDVAGTWQAKADAADRTLADRSCGRAARNRGKTTHDHGNDSYEDDLAHWVRL